MATYTLVQNDLIEIVMKGRLHGQTTRNVFHYRYKESGPETDGPGGLMTAIAAFDALVGVAWRAIASNEWHHISNTIQKVKGTRYQLIEAAVGADGDIEDNSLPSGVSAVASIRAITAERHSQGRKYFAGVPASAEDDSVLTPGFMTNFASVAGDMLSALPTAVADALVPTTLTPASGLAITSLYDVVSATPREVLRYQRRREVGVGE